MPAKECSKGGVPFATGKLSNSSVNNVHPQLGHLQTGFFVLCLIGVLGDYLKTLGPESYPAQLRLQCHKRLASPAQIITPIQLRPVLDCSYSPNPKSVD